MRAAGYAAADPDFGSEDGLTGRAIPAAVKREVWRRDRGRCRYVDRTSGRRCGSQHLLQGAQFRRRDQVLDHDEAVAAVIGELLVGQLDCACGAGIRVRVPW